MNTQQAYINGFVKRANEYGFSEAEAVLLLKEAARMPKLNPVRLLGKNKGFINEIGLHVPPDKGKYLSKIVSNPNPKNQV